MAFREEVLKTPAGRTAVRDYGARGSRPLLLLHGIAHNLAIWDAVAPRLANFAHVVSLDLMGHGHSIGDDAASLRSEVAAVTAVRDSCGLVEPVLVGHSYGAAVAALCAANVDGYAGVVMIEPDLVQTWQEILEGTPDEQLDLITGWSGTADEAAVQVEEVRRRGTADFGVSAGDVMAATKERSLVETESGRFERRPNAEYLRSMAATDTNLPEEARRHNSLIVDLYDRIKCPLLVILGADTDWVDASRALETRVALKPNIAVQWLPARHFPHLEHPSEVVSSIEDFLAQLN